MAALGSAEAGSPPLILLLPKLHLRQILPLMKMQLELLCGDSVVQP